MTTSPVDNRLLARTDWDADSYLDAALGGAFGDARIELIDGEVVEMAPIGSPHAFGEISLRTVLARALDPKAWTVGGQSTVRLTLRDVPEPDVWVAHGGVRTYASRHATAADLVLVAEVGESSRGYDRNRKLPRYALAGVPEVWLVDLVNRVVEVCTEPLEKDYASHVRYAAGDTVRLVVDGVELAAVAVHELLP